MTNSVGVYDPNAPIQVHRYQSYESMRADADPRSGPFAWIRKQGGAFSIQMYFHHEDKRTALMINTDIAAKAARVLACPEIMKHTTKFVVPCFGKLPYIVAYIPHVSDDVVADLARFQDAIDRVFNGGVFDKAAQ